LSISAMLFAPGPLCTIIDYNRELSGMRLFATK
jgi:hypothetical protein